MNKYQAMITRPKSLAFGHGIHACPGCSFAVNKTQVLLAALILNYDWRFKKGQGRRDNVFIDTMIAPNPMIDMEFRCQQVRR